MQIDFHHGTTYVLARLAGFDPASADIIAHAAQYVDDATNAGTIRFRSGQIYQRISSAHKMLDYRNLKGLNNHRVWIPFHFLPGNEMLQAGDNPGGEFERKIICRPDSPVARDMVNACLRDKDKPYSLHRLGITMHVYADTWAHQGFAGTNHPINEVDDVSTGPLPQQKSWAEKLKDYFCDAFDSIACKFVGDALPLGHGAALTLPDQPYLSSWRYLQHGTWIDRNNTDDFMQAATQLFRVLKDFKNGNTSFQCTTPLPSTEEQAIRDNFLSYTEEEGEDRHERWLADIENGKFGFRDSGVGYIAKGYKSWKDRALETRKETEMGDEQYKYTHYFLRSDWKQFHDALMAHRFDVLHDILPSYNICAA